MKEETLKKPMVVALLAMVCCLLWGSAFPCVKIGYQLFEIASEDRASQLLFAGYRFAMAGILVVLFGSLIGRKALIPKKESWKYIVILCMFQTVLQYVLFYMGLGYTTGVKSSIIVASNVFISIFFAVFLFRYEKLTKMKMIGCLIGFMGVVLINLTGNSLDFSFSLKGEGAILGSTVAYSLAAGLIKSYSKKENTVILSGYQFFLGGSIMVGIGYLMGGKIAINSASAFFLLFYMAIISAVAYTLWAILLKYNPVGRVSVFGFMNPVFGVILSALLLGERGQASGGRAVIALILVCLGIYIVNRPGKTEDKGDEK